MKRNKKELLLAGAVFLQKTATAAADVLWLVLLAEVIEEAVPENGIAGDMGKMAQYVLGLILLSAWKRMGYSFGRSLTLKLQSMVRFRLNCQIVEKAARIPYRLLEDQTFCELKWELEESIDRGLVWYTVQPIGNIMLYSVRMLGMCVLFGWVSPPLGVLFFLLKICHYLLTVMGKEQEAFLMPELERDSPERQYLEELALGREGAGERSLFSCIGYIGKKCDREWRRVRGEVFAASREREKMEFANQSLLTIIYVLMELALAALLAGGGISLGYFITLSIGACSLTQYNEEGEAIRRIQDGRLFQKQWKRFMELPEAEETGEQDGDRKETREFETLEFRNVSFRYPRTGRYVLHDLSFQLTGGGYYAFVGSNGSGKTTIVKLLAGLYDNYEGEILLNGTELREIPLRERRRIFAILFQDAARYEDTIARNISPGESREGFSEKPGEGEFDGIGESGGERLMQGSGEGERDKEFCERELEPDKKKRYREACERKQAQESGGKRSTEGARARELAEELVEEWASNGSHRFPQGADTFLGSMEAGGVILSEGEWQRLLVARELARPAQLRVLDEPMSSLDIFQQGRVYEQLMTDSGSNTMLLFSHHMSVVRSARRIFVLDGGTIAEEGSHERLMDRGGLYAGMYEAQAEG